MISLGTAFFTYLIIFAVIGAFRGWAKEILVLFSLIVALFLNTIVIRFLPNLDAILLEQGGEAAQFYVRAIFFILLAFFGYQTPSFAAGLSAKARREKLQDSLLGALVGAINGYLLVGTLWSFLHRAGYPLPGFAAPDPTNEVVLRIVNWLPPLLFGEPLIYFAVGIAFVFLLVVFV